MSVNSETAQNSFNPSWMQTASVRPKPNGTHRASTEDDSSTEMVEPVFAKYRYGREDILALIPKDHKPPDGLDVCPFFVEKPMPPTILTELNEVEQRLQANINSSKALSGAAHRTSDWSSKEGGETPGATPHPANAWTVAGSNRGSNFRQPHNNRWQTPGATDSPRSTKQGFPFLRSAAAPPAQSTNGEKKPARANPWADAKPRTHTATSDEGGNSNGGESDPWSQNDASSAWKTFSEEKKLEQPAREQTESSYSRAFGRGQNPWASHAPSKVEQVWGQPDVTQTADAIKSLELQTTDKGQEFGDSTETTSDELQRSQPPSDPGQPSSGDEWLYLDPNGVQRGPFDTNQMQAWFRNGYFQSDLQIMKVGDQSYTSLGELIRINGAITPFVAKRPQPVTSPSPAPQPPRNAWQQQSGSSASPSESRYSTDLTHEQVKALEEKERLLGEEQRRLREREELLKREEQERLERERKMQEYERELQRKQEEMERLAMEKEKELEIRRLQVLEYERKRREDLQKFEEERRLQLLQEEQEKRRIAELEFARQEQERQRLLMEAEIKRKQQEIEARERQQQFLQEEQNRQREEARERHRQEEELRRQQQQAAAVAAQRAQQQAPAAPVKAPWLMATKHQNVVKLEDVEKKTLLEIQAEEEKHLVRRREEEEKRRQTEAAQKKTVWNAQTGNAWSVPKNQPTPVPIPPAKEPAKQVQAKSEKKKQQQPKQQAKISNTKANEDPLTTWVIQRVKQLNPSVEPDVLAAFLLSLDSPNEVEAYVLTYFGENKCAKEFHQEFLAKRIELRPRLRQSDKDDLSGPAAAATHQSGNNGTVVNNTNATTAQKKKGKKGGKKVIDGLILGFRPAGDPNRFNAGEIDNTPPAPTRRR